MADEKQQTYPDIPISQWWNLRSFFIKRLVPNISIQYLKDALGYEASAARGIYRNLQLFGFIDKDGNTTDRANHWRIDEQYPQVCHDILTEIYPAGLVDTPPENVDRTYLISWFVRTTRVSKNYAGKNAAVFELLREADPTKGKDGKAATASPTKSPTRRLKPARAVAASVAPVAIVEPQTAPSSGNVQSPAEIKPEKLAITERLMTPSIHIDIQIHIAPDAPSQQIEDIFAAIERHLYKPRSGE